MLKLLHTSDWHLGHSLNLYERSAEHAQFLDWLLNTLVEEEIDVLLIAGDVFDNTNPASSSQNQLYRFLTQAKARLPHLGIVMTAGNHDSPGRLEAPAPLLRLLNTHVVGQTGRSGGSFDWHRIVLPLHNRAGELAAWCIAMPFLRPSDVPRVEGAADAYLAGIEALYAQAYQHALAQRSPGQAIVALGHCHITGSQMSADSERHVVIGGVESLTTRVFDPGIAYVALGHLHLAQKVGGDDTRRYCGSPLPLSFSEEHYRHQVLIVELAGETVATVRERLVPRSVPLLRIPPRPAPLADVILALQALDLPDVAPAQWPYLQVRVLLNQPEPGLRASIEAALAGKPVRLVRIETSTLRTSSSATVADVSVDELNKLQPSDYFKRLYTERFGDGPPPALMAAFAELIHSPTPAGDTP